MGWLDDDWYWDDPEPEVEVEEYFDEVPENDWLQEAARIFKKDVDESEVIDTSE